MSDKPTVRLEDTAVVADDGTVDMASLSKSGCDIDRVIEQSGVDE